MVGISDLIVVVCTERRAGNISCRYCLWCTPTTISKNKTQKTFCSFHNREVNLEPYNGDDLGGIEFFCGNDRKAELPNDIPDIDI